MTTSKKEEVRDRLADLVSDFVQEERDTFPGENFEKVMSQGGVRVEEILRWFETELRDWLVGVRLPSIDCYSCKDTGFVKRGEDFVSCRACRKQLEG